MRPRIESIEGHKIFFYDVVDSTMDIAHALAQDGERGYVVAATQRAGRGTGARRWLSPVGGLYTTAIFDYNPDNEMTDDLADGAILALIATFQAFDLDRCQIKPPNDVYLDDRKIAGVLQHIMPYGHLIGIGANLNNESKDVGVFAISYKDAMDQTVDLDAFLATFIRNAETLRRDYASQKESLTEQWKNLLTDPTYCD